MNSVAITGGGGFIGRAIVGMLRAEGVDCRVLGRSRYPDLEEQGVLCFQGDIANRDFVLRHLRDVDAVFHVAALAGIWGDWNQFARTNIDGTRNVIDACLENNIGIFVQTSTPSVVFAGENIIDGDENLDYAGKYLCGYAESKAIAEQMVLGVDQSVLKSCAIRPHLVWGPGDPHLIPRLLDRGRQGRLKIVGDGANIVDVTYIDNAAYAHVLAAKSLLSSNQACGKAYFIGQERPVQLWKWINELFERADIPPVSKTIPLTAAMTAGLLLEWGHRALCLRKEPFMTRFLALQLAKSHSFSHDRARNDFGYIPRISLEEGMDRLIHWIKHP